MTRGENFPTRFSPSDFNGDRLQCDVYQGGQINSNGKRSAKDQEVIFVRTDIGTYLMVNNDNVECSAMEVPSTFHEDHV